MTLYELQEQAKDNLKEALEWLIENQGHTLCELGPDDIDLAELIDSTIPVYTSDLLELASQNWRFREVNHEYDTMDEMIMANIADYLHEFLMDSFEDVKETIQPKIFDLVKSSDNRIVTQGKLTQYCPDDRLLEMRDDYISGTGDNISIDDWLDCWEEANLEELADADDDQINYLEHDDSGNWIVAL